MASSSESQPVLAFSNRIDSGQSPSIEVRSTLTSSGTHLPHPPNVKDGAPEQVHQRGDESPITRIDPNRRPSPVRGNGRSREGSPARISPSASPSPPNLLSQAVSKAQSQNGYSSGGGQKGSWAGGLQTQGQVEVPVKESETVEEEPKQPGLAVFDRRRKILLFFMCLAATLAALSVSILTPFFPREAAKKHLSSAEAGMVFSVFAIIEFIFCPLWGLLIPHVGVRFMYTTSTIFSSVSTILFGIVTEIPADQDDGRMFLVMSMLVRMCESIGMAAYVTAMFSVIANEFQDAITTAFSLVQTFHGLGFMLGPPVGGVLYQFGGFKLPFFVLGGALFLTSLSNCFFVPIEVKGASGEHVEAAAAPNHSPIAMLKLLRSPLIALLCVLVVFAAFIGGAIQPTFEPHLFENFQLEPIFVGAVFFAYPCTMTLATPVVGIIAQKIPGFLITTLGCFGMFVGVSLFAPSIFVFPPNTNILWLIICSLLIWGVMAACITVPTMEIWIQSAVLDGWPNDVSLHGLISGMWASSDALGLFIGPMLGAYFVDSYGFQNAFSYMAFLPLILGSLLVLYAIFTGGKPLHLSRLFAQAQERELEKRQKDEEVEENVIENEESPLLRPQSSSSAYGSVAPSPAGLSAITEEGALSTKGSIAGFRSAGPTPNMPGISVETALGRPSSEWPAGRPSSGAPYEGGRQFGRKDSRSIATYKQQLEASYLTAQAGALRASSSQFRLSRPSLADVYAVRRASIRARRESQQQIPGQLQRPGTETPFVPNVAASVPPDRFESQRGGNYSRGGQSVPPGKAYPRS